MKDLDEHLEDQQRFGHCSECGQPCAGDMCQECFHAGFGNEEESHFERCPNCHDLVVGGLLDGNDGICQECFEAQEAMTEVEADPAWNEDDDVYGVQRELEAEAKAEGALNDQLMDMEFEDRISGTGCDCEE